MEDMNNKAREIPYWKNILVNCPICWFKWEPTKYRKWNNILEIVLWIPFLIPWIIYTARRHINSICMCPKCRQLYLFETDYDDKLIDSLVDIKRKEMARFWIIIISFIILWMINIFWNMWWNTPTYKQNYWIQNSVNNSTNSVNYNQQINNSTASTNITNIQNQNDSVKREEQRKYDEELTKQLNGEAKEQKVENNQKSLKEQVSDVIQEAVDWINKNYEYITYFDSASCNLDCSRRIIDMNFTEPWFINDPNFKHSLKWYLWWVYNRLKEIKDLSLQVNFIYSWNTYITFSASKDWVVEKENAENMARQKMKNILKQIDYKYWEDIRLKQPSYIWASCSWDCINWIVNINFSDNIWRYDWTVKAHASDWSNSIIRAIPGFFEKIQINFICKWQTICSCTFTEYQMNSYAPKGCTYYWYKD